MVKTRSQTKGDFKDVMIPTKTSPVRRKKNGKTPVKIQSSALKTLGVIGFYTTLGFYLTKDFWIPYAHSHFTLI